MAFAETAQLAVRIDLTGNATAGINKLQHSVSGLGKSLGQTGKGIGQIGTGFAKAGLVAGAAIVTGLGAAAKAAIDFQDAFAGVRKTVEGTPAELQALDTALRSLSTRIPINYTDLAGIAQEAGALGVPTKEVAGFTEVVARLSAATVGLTTEAAAEAFGKLGNVLNLHGKDFEQAGSALVALGNAGASSEGDIVEVAKRFGAAGAQAKLSAAQVLGFSSAIASMGVEPEAAGSSLSRIFNNITKYIGTGSVKINSFAKVSGKSVKDFSKLFAKDASGAVQLFLTQLSKMDRFKAAAALKSAGIINVRDINAVLLLARGHAELKRQVDLSTAAYARNTDLAEVSKKRFDTLKAKITELKNAFVLAGVTLADGFLPALGRTVEKLQTFLSLDSNRSQLKSIGEDIGKAIDGINWDEILAGAKDFVGVMKDALGFAKDIFNVINKLPTEVKAAAAALLLANKASGGLIGTGIGNVVGGVAGAVTQGLGSRIPGVGRLFAQPVFVTNWPIGGLGGGGVGGGVGGGIGKLAKVGLGIEAIGAIVAVVATQQQISAESSAQARGVADTQKVWLDSSPSVDQLKTGLAAVDRGIADLKSNPLNVLVQGDALTTLQQMRGDLQTQLDSRNPKGSGKNTDDLTLAIRANTAAVKGLNPAAGKPHQLSGSLQAQIIGGGGKPLNDLAGKAIDDLRSPLAGISSGIRAIANRPVKPPSVSTNVNVNVNVTAGGISKTVTVAQRYGPVGGSRISDTRFRGFTGGA